MWRLQGLVGRVLHRRHGSGALWLPQNHHVEDEAISGSAVLSTSQNSSDSRSHEDGDGERRRRQRTFQSGYTDLPRYTALDAVGLGAAAVLFMQICRRIHSQFSSGAEPGPVPGAITAPSSVKTCGYRIILQILSRNDVLPRRSVLCLQGVSERHNQDQSQTQSSSSSSSPHGSRSPDHVTADSSISDHQRDLLSFDEEPLLSASHRLQDDATQENAKTGDENVKDLLSAEEKLEAAAVNLSHVGDASVPVILNIIGLEHAKSENYEEAFSCFLAAAQQGYSKAQFNTGVCYENGRGVGKNTRKALYYYQLAAVSGHRQAQYRYAKLLLTSRGQQNLEELNSAMEFLEQAAAAGLTQAQVCLASVYSRDPLRSGCKSIQYLKMAAESGDDTALFLLGQCYEKGFVVQQNLNTAMKFYKGAAQAGNKQAKRLLTPLHDSKEDALLRTIRSAPCFSKLPSPLASHVPHSTALHLLPHSWSTGNLCLPPSASSTPLHLHPATAGRETCQWTVGIG
ncbi:death ligand signal enhancer isoform 2-T2 [Pholidichthys leucotaenia]